MLFHNISAKNYHNRLICVEVIVCYTSHNQCYLSKHSVHELLLVSASLLRATEFSGPRRWQSRRQPSSYAHSVESAANSVSILYELHLPARPVIYYTTKFI